VAKPMGRAECQRGSFLQRLGRDARDTPCLARRAVVIKPYAPKTSFLTIFLNPASIGKFTYANSPNSFSAARS